ncbi:hypothetical protein [Micromonospora sp. WMMD980]|uniref:hypothetical protein n=1 Tax=Micromonospora sp. WMMD980 TaxID=3016088 RepID=UPI002415FC29|nr:hypothetical protein [Micromonospora sp. WMMD980]MDG4801984.1 hypothetical protein [Micromonospora sp. WMMD980]
MVFAGRLTSSASEASAQNRNTSTTRWSAGNRRRLASTCTVRSDWSVKPPRDASGSSSVGTSPRQRRRRARIAVRTITRRTYASGRPSGTPNRCHDR